MAGNLLQGQPDPETDGAESDDASGAQEEGRARVDLRFFVVRKDGSQELWYRKPEIVAAIVYSVRTVRGLDFFVEEGEVGYDGPSRLKAEVKDGALLVHSGDVRQPFVLYGPSEWREFLRDGSIRVER